MNFMYSFARILLFTCLFTMSSCKKGCEFSRPKLYHSPDQKLTFVDIVQVCGQGMATSGNQYLYLVGQKLNDENFSVSNLPTSDMILGATSSTDVSGVTWTGNKSVTIRVTSGKRDKLKSSHRGVSITWETPVYGENVSR
jgi:hypothetical protein